MAIGQFPHCDQRILHAPESGCSYCDGHPEWQELREAWGVAFTGQPPEDGQLPCPADARRPPGAENDHRRWAGNVATSDRPVRETAASRLLYGDGSGKPLPRIQVDPALQNELTAGGGIRDRSTGPSWLERTFSRIRGFRKDSAWDGAPTVSSVAPVGGRLTTDRSDPRLGFGVDDERGEQNDAYLVLSEEERAKGFVRPVRRSYRHLTCGSVTTMGQALAETSARDPSFYGATYCCACAKHLPVGEHGEFVWLDDGSKVGT